jgi:hypothetical protein
MAGIDQSPDTSKNKTKEQWSMFDIAGLTALVTVILVLCFISVAIGPDVINGRGLSILTPAPTATPMAVTPISIRFGKQNLNTYIGGWVDWKARIEDTGLGEDGRTYMMVMMDPDARSQVIFLKPSGNYSVYNSIHIRGRITKILGDKTSFFIYLEDVKVLP